MELYFYCLEYHLTENRDAVWSRTTSSCLSGESLITLLSPGSWRILGPMRPPRNYNESSPKSFMTDQSCMGHASKHSKADSGGKRTGLSPHSEVESPLEHSLQILFLTDWPPQCLRSPSASWIRTALVRMKQPVLKIYKSLCIVKKDPTSLQDYFWPP